jgi:membrane protein
MDVKNSEVEAGQGRDTGEPVPGEGAETPKEIPARGWLQIVRRAWKEANADMVPLLAAGVAFFAFLSIFPALIATVLLYGLVADPSQVTSQVQSLAGVLPAEARTIITDQLANLTTASSAGLGFGLVLSVLLALWSASGGVGHMVSAVNTAYDEQESRGWVKRKLLSLALTIGAILFVVIALGLVAVAPPVLNNVVTSTPLRLLLELARWLLVLVAVTAALAVIYRWAPSRDAPKFRWVSVGAFAATVLWLLVSIGFSLYVANFGKYAKTYGALAGVVVLLMWLWLTVYAVLLGAEVNAESEQQTAADTTKGAPEPMGERNAVKADSMPGQNDAGSDGIKGIHRAASPASPGQPAQQSSKAGT